MHHNADKVQPNPSSICEAYAHNKVKLWSIKPTIIIKLHCTVTVWIIGTASETSR
jgi:hypothetical protein